MSTARKIAEEIHKDCHEFDQHVNEWLFDVNKAEAILSRHLQESLERVEKLEGALRHQMYRNHDYLPEGCSGCEAAKAVEKSEV